MLRCTTALAALLALSSAAPAQTFSKIYTRPAIPPLEALDRLSLKMAWFAKMPMDGIKDGITSIQLLPGDDHDDVLLQSRSGLVQLMNAETGDLLWRTQVGLPYQYQQAPTANSHSVYITRETRLYALHRKTGKHRLFELEPKTDLIHLGVPINFAPSTGIICDEAAVFIPSDKRVTGYLMPKVSELQITLSPPRPGEVLKGKGLDSSPVPKFQGTFLLTDGTISRPLIMFGEALGVFTDDGTLISLNKYALKEKYHFKTGGLAIAGMGRFGKMAYVGSADQNIYALNLLSGNLRWRYLSGSAVVRTPQATAADVFAVSAVGVGMVRLNREDGVKVWRNPRAEFFLAVNPKFVYALDARRFLLVIDYRKGTTLSSYDLSDFVVPYSNVLSDRIYLANHDGSVLCLRHQAYAKPYRPLGEE